MIPSIFILHTSKDNSISLAQHGEAQPNSVFNIQTNNIDGGLKW